MTDRDPNILNYKASPVLGRFFESDARRRVIMGPFASGKSSGCCVEIVRRAMKQAAFNGVRRTKFAVVRNTFRQLSDTTIKTWLEWFPSGTLGYYAETKKTYLIKQAGLECEVVFRALDDDSDKANLLSVEYTGAYLNECREISRDIVELLDGRIKRYPRVIDGGPTWWGIWADTNPPELDSYWYHVIEGNDPDTGLKLKDNGWESFVQPGALLVDGGKYKPNPAAENTEYLQGGYDYYLDLARGKRPESEFVKVYILGQYGSTKAGKPVHPMFSRSKHVSRKPLVPNSDLPLLISADFGLTPAMTLKQQDSFGRILTYDNIATDNMGLERAINMKLKPLLNRKYDDFRIIVTGDPAGKQRGQANEVTCVKIFRDAGFRGAKMALTNDPLSRREATDYFLGLETEVGPGYLVDPGCNELIKALEGGFHYPVSRKGVISETPLKNMSSHIGEACEYGDMWFKDGRGGYGETMQDKSARLRAIAASKSNAGVYTGST